MADFTVFDSVSTPNLEESALTPMDEDGMSMTELLQVSEDRNESFSPADESSWTDSPSCWSIPSNYDEVRCYEEDISSAWAQEDCAEEPMTEFEFRNTYFLEPQPLPSESAQPTQDEVEHSTSMDCTPYEINPALPSTSAYMHAQHAILSGTTPSSFVQSRGKRIRRVSSRCSKTSMMHPRMHVTQLPIYDGGDGPEFGQFVYSPHAMPMPVPPEFQEQPLPRNDQDYQPVPVVWTMNGGFARYFLPEERGGGAEGRYGFGGSGLMQDGMFERGKKAKLSKSKRPPSLPKCAGNHHKYCTYELCPNPTHTSGGSWKFVTSETRAGNRDWSPYVGRLFCNACFTQFATKGFMERLGRAQPPNNPPSQPPSSESKTESHGETTLNQEPELHVKAECDRRVQPTVPVPVKVEQE